MSTEYDPLMGASDPASLFKLKRLAEELPGMYQRMHAEGEFAGDTWRNHLPLLQQCVPDLAERKILDYGCGPKGGLAQALGDSVTPYDPYVPAYREPPETDDVDLLFSCDVLEHVLPGELATLFHRAFLRLPGLRDLFLIVTCRPAKKTLPDSPRNVHLTVRQPEWWLGLYDACFLPHFRQQRAVYDFTSGDLAVHYSRIEVPVMAPEKKLKKVPAVARPEGVTAAQQQIVDQFHRYWYRDAKAWKNTRWRDVDAMKCPMDMLVLAEIVYQTQPDLIIELGSAQGGSALFLADLQTLFISLNSRVIAVDDRDVFHPVMPSHPRIVTVRGRSTDPETVKRLSKYREKHRRCMVLSDSDHSYETTLVELETYAPMVTPDCYFIVEDTNIGMHPINKRPEEDSPIAAVRKFLSRHPEFQADRSREQFQLTFNPQGFLLRQPDVK